MHQNLTIFQTFEWNLPADRNHYQRLLRVLPALRDIGITALWLPPACKAGNSTGNGYDIYDLYDLGEFEQRGSRATKWGPKEDLMALATKAKDLSVDLYFDAVLNHRCGGDAKEMVRAVEVDKDDRLKELCRPKEVEVWLQYHFPGREGRYSGLRYDWQMFNASDWDDRAKKHGIYKIADGGKCWAEDVSDEWRNGDYLMFNNLDYTNEKLREDVKNWGVWVTEHLGLAGFRLDAMQHFSQRFSSEWIRHVRQNAGRDVFVVGEYWNGDVDVLTRYLEKSPADLHLYDAPLLYNLARLSWSKTPDLRTVFHRTLVMERPNNAVTLVMNHDTQKGQVMDAPVQPEFLPLAYALILLRQAGYPCVFYGDIFGISEPFASKPNYNKWISDLILARKLYAYGEQQDYFQEASCIGWVRKGLSQSGGSQAAGMAVLMSWVGKEVEAHGELSSTARPSWMRRLSSLGDKFGKQRSGPKSYQKRMNVGAQHAGEVWTDVSRVYPERIIIDRDGYGVFTCKKNSVVIYLSESAEGRERFRWYWETDIYHHNAGAWTHVEEIRE